MSLFSPSIWLIDMKLSCGYCVSLIPFSLISILFWRHSIINALGRIGLIPAILYLIVCHLQNFHMYFQFAEYTENWEPQSWLKIGAIYWNSRNWKHRHSKMWAVFILQELKIWGQFWAYSLSDITKPPEWPMFLCKHKAKSIIEMHILGYLWL